jgi:O-antigen ligase
MGGVLAIETFVFLQFFELTFISVGGFDLSAQKLLAILLFPLALILIGRVSYAGLLFVLFVLMVLVNSTWYVVNGHALEGRAVSANLSALFVFIGSIVLFTALRVTDEGLRRLGDAWLRWSLVTSAVCLLQALSVFPLLTVPSEQLFMREAVAGFYRGVGFKADPNFQALMLVIGAGFVVSANLRLRIRLPSLVVIFVGILATFSRMGMLLFALTLLFGVWLSDAAAGNPLKGTVRSLGWAAGVTVFAVLILMTGLLPDSVSDYFTQRFREVASLGQLTALSTSPELDGSGNPTSAIARGLIALAAFRIWLANMWIGIGAHRSAELVFAETGFRNVAHNSYVELLVTGGLIGFVFLLVYFRPLLSLLPLLGSGRDRKDESTSPEAMSVLLTVLFAVAFLFLSLNYNSVLYLPVVIALAVTRRDANEWEGDP